MSLKNFIDDLKSPLRDAMFSVRIPEKDLSTIRTLAKQHGVSQGDLVIALARQEADRLKKLKKARSGAMGVIVDDDVQSELLLREERDELLAENRALKDRLARIEELLGKG